MKHNYDILKLQDRKLHEDCFRCSTCGNSLKNQGYFNINEKLYCEIHAQQAAQTTHSPNRIITPNCTTIRSKDSKPTSPSFQVPIKPTFNSQPAASSPSISAPWPVTLILYLFCFFDKIKLNLFLIYQKSRMLQF